MPVPIVYRRGALNQSQVFNFEDIASGTGYVLHYGGQTDTSKRLSNAKYYSDPYTDAAANAGTQSLTYAKVIDYDYDVLLNKSVNAKGTAIVNVPFAVKNDSTGQSDGYIIARIRKYDGSTETEIAVSDTSEVATSSSTTLVYKMACLEITIPLTHYKKGERVRLTIEGWLKTSDAAKPARMHTAYDPNSRTTDWDTTGAVPSQLVLQLPVKIPL